MTERRTSLYDFHLRSARNIVKGGGDFMFPTSTSSAMGHSVRKMLAMAYVDAAHSWPGNNLVVEINGRPIPARVSPTPFFDPEGARIRSEPQEDERRSQPAAPRAVPTSTNYSRPNVPADQSSGGSNGS